jgi:AcrR family transcriptional regulator
VTTTSDERRALSRRERARAATIDEIKQTAAELMREYGTIEVRFTDIAREMGMTAPGLYRYFADRDELLTALIVDAYNELGGIVAEATASVPDEDIWGRLLNVAQAYRRWARQEPQQFALILGMPVPGYKAPEDGPTTEAAIRAMTQLQSLFFDAAARGVLEAPLVSECDPAVTDAWQVEQDKLASIPGAADVPEGMSPKTFQAMIHCWAALHGFTALEAHNHLEWLSDDARDAMFEANVRLTAISAGLPVS